MKESIVNCYKLDLFEIIQHFDIKGELRKVVAGNSELPAKNWCLQIYTELLEEKPSKKSENKPAGVY